MDVEIREPSIGGDSSSPFPAHPCCCSFQRAPGLAGLLTEHMLRGGRRGGEEGDSTDNNVQEVGGANEHDGEGES